LRCQCVSFIFLFWNKLVPQSPFIRPKFEVLGIVAWYAIW
jgi:hypothetical protein